MPFLLDLSGRRFEVRPLALLAWLILCFGQLTFARLRVGGFSRDIQFQRWHGDRNLCFALYPLPGVDPRRFQIV
jgi:hypothetical protein